jgi:hypothetical protein
MEADGGRVTRPFEPGGERLRRGHAGSLRAVADPVDDHVGLVPDWLAAQHDLEAVLRPYPGGVDAHAADRKQPVALRIEARGLGIDDDQAIGFGGGRAGFARAAEPPVEKLHGAAYPG